MHWILEGIKGHKPTPPPVLQAPKKSPGDVERDKLMGRMASKATHTAKALIAKHAAKEKKFLKDGKKMEKGVKSSIKKMIKGAKKKSKSAKKLNIKTLIKKSVKIAKGLMKSLKTQAKLSKKIDIFLKPSNLKTSAYSRIAITESKILKIKRIVSKMRQLFNLGKTHPETMTKLFPKKFKKLTDCIWPLITKAQINKSLKNTFMSNSASAGGWGGSCTCPNGQVYQVGDQMDSCGSLSCKNGKSGTCNHHNGPWSGNKVTCEPINKLIPDRRVGAFGGSCKCPNGKSIIVGDNMDSCKSLACDGGIPGKCSRNVGKWSGHRGKCFTGWDAVSRLGLNKDKIFFDKVVKCYTQGTDWGPVMELQERKNKRLAREVRKAKKKLERSKLARRRAVIKK